MFFFANCKVGGLHQGKGELNQTGYHSILRHHAIPSGTWLEDQVLVLMQDNDLKYTNKICWRYNKSKDEHQVIQPMSWPVQTVDLNPIVLVWDELDRKLELNNPQVRLSSGNSCRKAGQNYLQW